MWHRLRAGAGEPRTKNPRRPGAVAKIGYAYGRLRVRLLLRLRPPREVILTYLLVHTDSEEQSSEFADSSMLMNEWLNEWLRAARHAAAGRKPPSLISRRGFDALTMAFARSESDPLLLHDTRCSGDHDNDQPACRFRGDPCAATRE